MKAFMKMQNTKFKCSLADVGNTVEWFNLSNNKKLNLVLMPKIN